TDDKYLKRAGMDYWHEVTVEYHDSIDEVLEKYAGSRFYFVETRVDKLYTDFSYRDGDFFVFGKESAGLPQALLEQHKDTCIRLPMRPGMRSLNLSNSAAIVLFEALRQTGFNSLD